MNDGNGAAHPQAGHAQESSSVVSQAKEFSALCAGATLRSERLENELEQERHSSAVLKASLADTSTALSAAQEQLHQQQVLLQKLRQYELSEVQGREERDNLLRDAASSREAASRLRQENQRLQQQLAASQAQAAGERRTSELKKQRYL
jgi:hypothetical protein